MLSKNSQSEAALKHCKLNNADQVLNIYFFDAKTLTLLITLLAIDSPDSFLKYTTQLNHLRMFLYPNIYI